MRLPTRDQPWIFRTYAGHTSVEASNQLFHDNLRRGQTGLSIAFDLPTQCGYDSDHPLAIGEVGRVGVPVNSIDDMRALLDGIPLAGMNTSMTINATAMWLYALYLALAAEEGVALNALVGTTQNDIVKEYLARGTYIFPPTASVRLVADMYEHAVLVAPRFNPANVCSYHLQEAGATPVQEIAYALAAAMLYLDALAARRRLCTSDFHAAVGRVSFFCNAGMRFVEEACKMRALQALWQRTCQQRYGIRDPKLWRLRYGVQVNSLGLTEEQPENNAWRIAIETLGVLLSRDARCRALQLPAWNEALTLPGPWDQQWSLRLQQILAYETDLLEYPDILEGSHVVEALTAELVAAVDDELGRIEQAGGALAALESGALKAALVAGQAERVARISRGDQVVVGRNRFREGLSSPLEASAAAFRLEPHDQASALRRLARTRAERDDAQVRDALRRLAGDAAGGENLVEASVACAVARATTGEWASTLRGVFGEYRPRSGVEGQQLARDSAGAERVRSRVEALMRQRGRRPRLVVAKAGLDGHSNGAETIAICARQCGFEVVYSGIRLTTEQIARQAVEEDASVIGLSVLSGAHVEIVTGLAETLRRAGAADIPIIIGGVIPHGDHARLAELGVRAVFTARDYDPVVVIDRIVDVLESS